MSLIYTITPLESIYKIVYIYIYIYIYIDTYIEREDLYYEIPSPFCVNARSL